MKSAQPSEMTEERLEIIAAANAVSCWFDGEGKLAQQIQQRPFSDAGQFRKWLSLWGLARRMTEFLRKKQVTSRFPPPRDRLRFESARSLSAAETAPPTAPRSPARSRGLQRA